MSTKPSQPKPNDQRADVKNPNNPAYQADRDNRSRQLNPEDPMHQPAPEPAPAPAPNPGKK